MRALWEISLIDSGKERTFSRSHNLNYSSRTIQKIPNFKRAWGVGKGYQIVGGLKRNGTTNITALISSIMRAYRLKSQSPASGSS